MSSEGYQILTVKELNKKLKAESRTLFSYDLVLESLAFVFYLKSGKVALLPNNSFDSPNGVLFDNVAIFKHYQSLDNFPIENQSRDLDEIFQEEILGLPDNLDDIISYLTSLYGIKSNKLAEILNAAQDRNIATDSSRKKKVISFKEMMYRDILLGEYIRKSQDGKFVALKKYGTFNPFYTLGILQKDSNIIEMHWVQRFFFDGKISLALYIKNCVKPTLHTGALGHYKGYKIL